jgi:hypothetical protein
MGTSPVKVAVNKRRAHGASRRPGYPPPRRDRPRRRWIAPALAASLALAIVGTAQDWPMRLQADAMTASGERRDVTLDDGSLVQLNTGSAISFDLSGDRRIVRLLKVRRHPSSPPSSRRYAAILVHDPWSEPASNTGPIAEPVQPHIRSPLWVAAPISRIRRARAQ